MTLARTVERGSLNALVELARLADRILRSRRSRRFYHLTLYKRGEFSTSVCGLHGRFHFHDGCDADQLATEWFEREQLTTLLERLKPNDVVCEIGGCIGTWTVFMAKRASHGRVHVFEPEPGNAARLAKNIKLNGLSNVERHHVAVGDRNGTARFGVAPIDKGGSHSIVPDDAHRESIEVEMLRLDDALDRLGMPQPTVLKIDCEGAEWHVLTGMPRLLASGYIREIFLEVHPDNLRRAGHDAAGVLAILEQAGYREVHRWTRDTETLCIFEHASSADRT